MSESTLRTGAVIGGLTSIPVMAILYLANRIASLAFVPFDLFDWMARILPGDLVTVGIDAMVNLLSLLNLTDTSRSAKLLEQLMALLMFIFFGMVLGGVVTVFTDRFGQGRRQKSAVRYGIITGLIGYIILMIVVSALGKSERLFVDALWLAIVLMGWGAIIGLLVARFSFQPLDEELDQSARDARRAMLYRLVASSAGIALGAIGLGRVFGSVGEPEGLDNR